MPDDPLPIFDAILQTFFICIGEITLDNYEVMPYYLDVREIRGNQANDKL